MYNLEFYYLHSVIVPSKVVVPSKVGPQTPQKMGWVGGCHAGESESPQPGHAGLPLNTLHTQHTENQPNEDRKMGQLSISRNSHNSTTAPICHSKQKNLVFLQAFSLHCREHNSASADGLGLN